MSRPDEPLWGALRQAGLVQGEPPEAERIESPWYVKGLLAFSGWLAAFFLLGFIGVGFQFVMESGPASFATGGVMMGAAYAVLRAPRNEFLEHLALAMSIAGQALAVWAFYEMLDTPGASLWALVALLEVLLAVVMPHFVHRVLSACAAAVTLAMSLACLRLPSLAPALVLLLAAWLWRNEFRYPRYMRPMRAIGYGLVAALIQLTGMALFFRDGIGWLIDDGPGDALLPPWPGETATGAVMLYVVWKLLRRSGLRPTEPFSLAALLGTLLFCGVSLEARGVAVGMTIILLGFAGGNRVLQGLGIAALLFYISSYYYLLDTTLLVKSATLLMVGIVLLTGRRVLLAAVPRPREVGDG